MKTKDYEPIKFEIFQTDMEKIMYILNETIEELTLRDDKDPLLYNLKKIYYEFQHKIDVHKERGEWI